MAKRTCKQWWGQCHCTKKPFHSGACVCQHGTELPDEKLRGDQSEICLIADAKEKANG